MPPSILMAIKAFVRNEAVPECNPALIEFRHTGSVWGIHIPD